MIRKAQLLVLRTSRDVEEGFDVGEDVRLANDRAILVVSRL